MTVTKDDLKRIMPNAGMVALGTFCDPINSTLSKYLIDTPLRASAFIAQIAHESGQLIYTKELASGRAYEGRLDLGNTEPGDGIKFKGRGLIQITGRFNYEALSKEFGVDFISKPELLEGPLYATESAGWFWNLKGLNALADIGDFQGITRRINGGLTGYLSRISFYARAKTVFGI
jgi:putative chitinase